MRFLHGVSVCAFMPPVFRLTTPMPGMHSFKRSLGMALLLSAMGLPSWADPSPRFVCDEPVADFGFVPASSESLSHDYLLRTAGQPPLELRTARAAGGGFDRLPPPDPIPPGQSAPFHAAFRLDGRTGPQSKTIILSSNDPDRPTAFLSFRCDVVPLPSVSPSALYFGRLDHAATRDVTLSADRPFSVRSASLAHPGCAVGIDSPDPSPLHRLSVAILPSMPSGPFGDTLTVDTDLPLNSRFLIPVTGDWHPAP